jgi:hypothetical protein
VWVSNTNIQNIGGTGVAATTTAGVVTLGIDQLRVELSKKGIESGNYSRVTVTNSLIQNAGREVCIHAGNVCRRQEHLNARPPLRFL